jgi:hypothetical protein
VPVDHHPTGGRHVQAVRDVSFTAARVSQKTEKS